MSFMKVTNQNGSKSLINIEKILYVSESPWGGVSIHLCEGFCIPTVHTLQQFLSLYEEAEKEEKE